MLELDVLEQRPLSPLEPSVSRTVANKWPVLNVPFIHELKIGPDPGDLDQVALQVNVQEAHYSLRETSEDTTLILEPKLISCARNKDTRELFIVNSAVMLDTVGKVTPMEICDSAQNMMLHESGESSNMQIREDFFEITIARDLTNELHMKDGHILTETVSKMNDKAAGMEVMGTGAVLQSEQSLKVGILPNEPNSDESSDLEISDSVKGLAESPSLAPAKTCTSTSESPEGFLHDDCLQCTANYTGDGDSVKCLEVEHLPYFQSTSTQRTFDPVDFPRVPKSFHETSICKDPGFSCINDAGSATCLLERLEPNTANEAPQENVPRDKVLDMNVGSVEQETDTILSDEKQNNVSVTYLSKTSSAAAVGTRLQDVPSDTLKVDLLLYDKSVIENDSISPGNLKDDLSFKLNFPPCLENLTGAKALDTEECPFSSSTSDCTTPISDGTSDCQDKYTCANKDSQIESSDSSPRNVLCSAPLTSKCGEPLYAKSTRSPSSVDCSETSFIGFNSHSGDSELDGESKEQLFMSVSPSNGLDINVRITKPKLNSPCLSKETENNRCTIPQSMLLHLSEGTEKLATTQSLDLCGVVPAVINDSTTSLKISEVSHCLVDTEDSSCGLSDSNAVFRDVIDCDKAVPSHMQSNLLITRKEKALASSYLKVPSQTEDYCTDETPLYALVPYVDILGFLSKPEVNSLLSLREPKNVTNKKTEFQNLKKENDEFKGYFKEPPKVSLKEVCLLKALKNPQKVVNLSRHGGEYRETVLDLDSFNKMAQEVKQNVSADLIPSLAEFPSTEIHNRKSGVLSIPNQSEGICHFNSGALCDFSVPLEVHNMSGLPQFVDVRRSGDRLQSQQTNVSFPKEKLMPHLSLSDKYVGDLSALLLPTSLPASTIAPTGSKNSGKSPSEVFLGSVQLHVTNHADSSVQKLGNSSKSFTLKQDTEPGPRHNTILEEPFKASDSVQCVQISPAEVNGPTQSMQANVLREKKSPCMLYMETFLPHEKKPSPGKAVIAIKTKTTRVKSQRSIFNPETKIHEKSLNDGQLLKVRPRQSAGCHMEMLSGTTENCKKYNLRPAPQSLNCATSLEAKRPKISNGKDIGSTSSGMLNCVNKLSQKSESHQLSQARQACKRKEPPSAIRNSFCLGTDISVKRQANRKCKNFSAQENFLINSKTPTCKSSPVLRIHDSHDINVINKSLPPSVDLNLISKPHSKMTSGGAVSQKPTHLQKCTQDVMLLNKLSRIANRLTAQSKDSCKSKFFSSNLKVIPFHGVKIQARKLLNVFSCVNMRMNCQPGQNWQENVCLTSSRDHLVSQSMNLYPTYFPKTNFSSLGDAFSLNACENLTFPVSFHVNIAPSCLTDFLKFNPPDFILGQPQATARSLELSEWTLSLFLSSHVPADTENVHLLTQWNPQFRSLESRSESSHTRKSVRKSGCSMLGLHTVLALSSPGCYRLWTRRRNLGSRIPTVQKLSVTQFAHGLKGSPPQLSRKGDQFSSLAFSLGRVLSTWSRHGLSSFSSDCASTHPNCSVWLPSQIGNIISVCRSQNPVVCVPQLPLDTSPQYSLPVQNLNPALKPRISHQEDIGLAFCLSTQKKDDPRPVCWLSSQYKNDVEFSSCSLKPEDGPKHALIFSTVQKDNFNLQLGPSSQQKNNLERPLGFSSLKHDLKPVVNISQCDVAIQEPAAFPDSLSDGQARPFEERENIVIPCTQSQNKDEGNEKGSFERKPQRVSQIRIRKTVPKPDPNLTPMGLPKPKRVNKKEFSLEDIYTNKNYKSPPPARSLETIFEEPKEKNGVLISVSQQKRKRILEFRDCTVPRLKRPKGKVKVMTSCKRGRKAAMEGVQLDALLIQKLMDLENCLLEEEALERGLAASERPS